MRGRRRALLTLAMLSATVGGVPACRSRSKPGATGSEAAGGRLGRVLDPELVDPTEVKQSVSVDGMKWTWIYTMEGDIDRDELWLRPGVVRLDLKSKDERHDFRVDALGLDVAVKPGETTTVFVEVTRAGTAKTGPDATCPPELAMFECMATKITAYDEAGFERIVAQQRGPLVDEGETWAQFGLKVFERSGCSACHGELAPGASANHMAPQLRGIAGTQRPLVGGTTVTADAAYLKRALLEPAKELVDGYEASQPTYAGVLDEGEVRGLVELVQCVGEMPPASLECGELRFDADAGDSQ